MLPPLPRGHLYFQASDNSLHSIPRENLAQARRIDPGLRVLRQLPNSNRQGSNSNVTKARPRASQPFRRSEREVLRTLYFVVLAR